jgi:hypothetical protein
MTAVKVECDCGQRYAFDVEPVHGRMPAPVVCPVCGADGTAKANIILAQSAVAVPRASLAAPAMRVALAAPVALAVAAPPPPMPPSLPPPRAVTAAPPPIPVPAGPRPAIARPRAQKPTRGKDGWNGPETGLHKLGQYVAFTPALLAALVAWHFLKIPALILILAVIVGVFGVTGGMINVWGRGPIWAGACVGLITSLSGFFTVTWWIHYRQGDAWWIEVVIGFVLGCLPGILVQYLLQKLVLKTSR